MNHVEQVGHMNSNQDSNDTEIQIPMWMEQPLSSKTPRKSIPVRQLKTIMCGDALTYYWVHAAYFAVLAVAGTMSLWWCRGKETITFVDCIFNAVSALTATGLSSVLLRDFTHLGLFALMVLMLLGNTISVSLLSVYVRRLQHFRDDSAAAVILKSGDINTADDNHLAVAKENTPSAWNIDRRIDINSETGVAGSGECQEIRSETIKNCSESKPSQDSQHETGLLERQALITLSWLVPLYMFVFMAFGFVCIICYTSFSSSSSRVRALYQAEEVNAIYTAIFLSISAFSNTGLSPLDENMIPFAAAPLVLVSLAVLILAGNTMFPASLRFVIWGVSRWKRPDDPQKKVYEYLLQYPRRCYTHLFRPVHTIWLVATVVAFNIVDLVAFCSLEWDSAAGSSHPGVKLMDGLFQSLNTRSAGMNVLPLYSLSPPLLVLYTSMMYIAAYPVFLSRQHSRLACSNEDVNRGHQLFINPTGDRSSEQKQSEEMGDNKLLWQFSKLFTRDSAVLFVHVFLICTAELGGLDSDPLNYTVFSIVFEVVSAYGNVGLSLGYSCRQWMRASMNDSNAESSLCKDVPYSFSGMWRVQSKLILVCCMLLGRYRSLPNNMDPAINVVGRSKHVKHQVS